MTKFAEVQESRNGAADLLKGIAVLLMIQVHIMEQLAQPDLYNSILGKFSLFLGGPACAPVFMAVMGYFLASSGKSMKGFILRGLMLFAGGILLNIGRSANLLVQIYQGESDLNPLHFIFGADILTLAGLSIMVIGMLRSLFRSFYLPYLLLGFAVAAASPFMTPSVIFAGYQQYLNAFLTGGAEWSYFPLFPWIAYILTGYSFRLFLSNVEWVKRIDIKEHFYLAVPLWLVILFTLPWASTVTSDLAGSGGYYHHGILFFLWTLIFMISYLIVILLVESELGEHKITLAIKWLGAQVTIVYIVQWLIIGNVASVLYRSQHLFQVASWFPVIAIASLLIGFMYLRIKSTLFRKS
jgi:uncharacterized membrane protein